MDRDNVWMIQSGCGSGFLKKTPFGFMIFRQRCGQNFDRHQAAKPGIFSEIDLAHPAMSDFFENFIVKKVRSRIHETYNYTVTTCKRLNTTTSKSKDSPRREKAHT